jgi:hypothetical protein
LVPGEAVEYRARIRWILLAARLAGIVLILLGTDGRYGPWLSTLDRARANPGPSGP